MYLSKDRCISYNFLLQLLAAAMQTQISQDSVFALGQILMILITLEVAVSMIQIAQELAVGLHNAPFSNYYSNSILFQALTQSHVMVREPAAVVTAEFVHVTADLLGIVAMLRLVLECLYAVTVEAVLREGRYAIVKLDSTVMTVQVSQK